MSNGKRWMPRWVYREALGLVPYCARGGGPGKPGAFACRGRNSHAGLRAQRRPGVPRTRAGGAGDDTPTTRTRPRCPVKIEEGEARG